MAKRFADFDAYFSFGGAITFKNANKEDVVKAINQDRLLLETDCPYMTPHPYRGTVNYPKYINLVAQKMQEWFSDIDINTLTTKNAKRVFRI
jgi:TatD DNase family protein